MTIFTVWAPYDDEGTVLVSLQAFAEGETLYRDVYSPYGPFYFELFGGLLALTGEAVTTDASRTTVIVLWLVTSFFLGLAAQRLTGRPMLGAIAMMTAFACLYTLAAEPMHPQGLCVLLLSAFVLLVAFGPTGRPALTGAAAGALLAALFLTKLNLGSFAIAALALAAALAIGPLRARRWLSWPIVAAFLALPVAIVARDLDLGWVRDFAASQVLAMVAIVIAAWPLGRPREGEVDDGTLRWIRGAAIGFGFACVAIATVVLLNGSSPFDVYGGVVTEALRVRDVVVSPLEMSSTVTYWAIAAVAGATASVRLRRKQWEHPVLWPGLLRAAAGLAIWLSVAGIAITPLAGNPDSLPAVLAWIATIPPAGAEEPPYRRLLRVLLPALAVVQVMQVYPVAGSQVGIASLTFVPVGALCLADALTSFREWSAARGETGLNRLRIAITVGSVAVLGVFAVETILRPINRQSAAYRNLPTTSLPGAGQMRFPWAEAESYSRLVTLLHRHGCSDFIALPNINSLYLWSGIEPPRPYAPGAWPGALDAARQQRIVDDLRSSPRPCAIRNDGLAALWLSGASPPDRPLVNYVVDDFRPVEEVGGFVFMLPAQARPASEEQRQGPPDA